MKHAKTLKVIGFKFLGSLVLVSLFMVSEAASFNKNFHESSEGEKYQSPVHRTIKSISVTNLAYEERVREYIRIVSAEFSSSASYSENENRNRYSVRQNDRASGSYAELEGTYSYVTTGELKKFIGDIKGQLISSGNFKVIEQSATASSDEEVFDITKRIKDGQFKNAEYVLFGTVTDIQFSNELNEVVDTRSFTKVFSASILCDFRLINTRTFEVVASFSASGIGSNAKIISNPTEVIIPNRADAIKSASKALADDVIQQIDQQLESF